MSSNTEADSKTLQKFISDITRFNNEVQKLQNKMIGDTRAVAQVWLDSNREALEKELVKSYQRIESFQKEIKERYNPHLESVVKYLEEREKLPDNFGLNTRD